MSYYLTIDQGNSSAKIALFSNFDIVESRRVDALTMQEIDSLIDRRELTAAIYSSVAADGDDIVDALATRCKRVYRMSSDLLLTVEIGYDNPSSRSTSFSWWMRGRLSPTTMSTPRRASSAAT